METATVIIIGIAIGIGGITTGYFLSKGFARNGKSTELQSRRREVLRARVANMYLHIIHKGEGPAKGYESRAIGLLIEEYSIKPHNLCLVESNECSQQLLEANVREFDGAHLFHVGDEDGYIFAATVVGRESAYDDNPITLDYKIYRFSNSAMQIVFADCIASSGYSNCIDTFGTAFCDAMNGLADMLPKKIS
jgi:hypothetical protein